MQVLIVLRSAFELHPDCREGSCCLSRDVPSLCGWWDAFRCVQQSHHRVGWSASGTTRAAGQIMSTAATTERRGYRHAHDQRPEHAGLRRVREPRCERHQQCMAIPSGHLCRGRAGQCCCDGDSFSSDRRARVTAPARGRTTLAVLRTWREPHRRCKCSHKRRAHSPLRMDE